MKKIFFLFLFLSGCMQAPSSSFRLEESDRTYTLNVNQVETVSMVSHFDSLNHIEKEMPLSPEESISHWVQNHLNVYEGDKKLWIIIHQAEMLREEKLNQNWFKLDEETYILNYQLEIQLRQNKSVLKSSFAKGKGFITLAKKASLSKKEESWAWLIQKMLRHLEAKITTDFEDVLVQ